GGREVGGGPPPKQASKTASPKGKAAEVPKVGEGSLAGKRSIVPGTLLLLAGALGSWCLTFWLFTRASRGPAEWLGWGLSDTLFPPPGGLYRVASVIAGLWGGVRLALPLGWARRTTARGRGAART